MLAYVFWHWPRSGVPVPQYEAALSTFHQTLATRSPAGFQRSSCWRIVDAPWLPSGSGYEDWYLLDGAAALDSIGPGATMGATAAPHDAAAGMSVGGTAGLYKPAARDQALETGETALWFAKPNGMPYTALLAQLHEVTDRLWMRVLVLGPTPEFCLLDLDSTPIPAAWQTVLVRRDPIWPG